LTFHRALLVVPLLVAEVAQAAPASPGATKPYLLQRPTVSRTQIAFAYGGDLWIVERSGGRARHLTTGIGVETDPFFSPDGSLIAFTGEYDGNLDVYVVPATGGVPRRLTYHPYPDEAVGWTPDGKQILFRSWRHTYSRFSRLYTIPVEGGGLPTELPLPDADHGSFSPDGLRLAYAPTSTRFQAWKRYRGGLATPLWIATLADSSIEKIPRTDSNDTNPMWMGDKIYFLSDRAGRKTLFSFDTRTKEVKQLVENKGLDITWASAGPDVIAYEQFGAIHLYDPATGTSRPVEIQVAGDLPGVRPRFEKVAGQIRNAALSPHGARAVFEARGEIFTVPAKKGDVRNLTRTPGAADRDPAWSPDGKWIAYFSDEWGEYQLHIVGQDGLAKPHKIPLGDSPSFYYSPVWSPDSRKIAYTDKRLRLWVLDLLSKKSVLVDTDRYEFRGRTLEPAWSPDSRFLAYTKELPSSLRAVFVYSVKTGKIAQLTDGMSDARFAVFDKSGKYLYFAASTDVGPSLSSLDMSSMGRGVTRSLYVIVLRKDLPSPLAPENDEEKPEGATPKIPKKGSGPGKKPRPVRVRIDLGTIGQRILGLPLPAKNYLALDPGKPGTIYLTELGARSPVPFGPPLLNVSRYDLNQRKLDPVIAAVSAFDLSFDGEKMLYRRGKSWFIAPTGPGPGPGMGPMGKPGQGRLRIEEMEAYVDPRAEWRQMFREVLRLERDFFYDPGWHGLDLDALRDRYEPYLDNLAHRADLNYLFNEMLGELSVGHLYVRGGDLPPLRHVKGGLLGADYRIENGRYRFSRVYNGENWNPQLRAPLTQPGVNVAAGEYLLAVNGQEIRPPDDLDRVLQGTAGKATVLRVGPNPTEADSRQVTVVPTQDERPLRYLAWIEGNRRKVDALSRGRLAYVHLPDTAFGGYSHFNRFFFAQLEKEGAIIDERNNAGGLAADYIIDYLARPLLNYWTTRSAQDSRTPQSAIFGPKVMIINEYAGSGGDLLPWYFRKRGLGPLIGKRTWGGLVGIYDTPLLIDGGLVTTPRMAFWNPKGEWEVENRGVPPDIEVEQDPKEVRLGRDPQLEKAIAVALEELARRPPPKHKRPAYPNYHGDTGLGRKSAASTSQ
jgi:tricorn protease